MFASITKQFTTSIYRLTPPVRHNSSSIRNVLSALGQSGASQMANMNVKSTKATKGASALLPEDVRSKGLELPRTGAISGRMVRVQKQDLNTAFKRLRGLISANNIKGEKMAQRFHKKAGKVLEEKQIRRKKRVFDEGVRRLMWVVTEAKRRGY